MTIPRNLSFLAQGASSTGVLSVPYGGTGLTTLTANYIPYGNGTNAFNSVSTFQSDGTRLSIGGSLQSGVTFYSNAASGDNKLRADASAGTTSSYLVFVNTTITSVGTENSSGGNLVAGSSPYATILANSGAYPLQLGTNNTVRATIFASGGVSIGNTTDPGAGNLRFATTGTNGIYFGSTSRLDTYETGTWTPTGNGITFASASGKYTKIGNLVTLTFSVTFPTTTNTNTAYISSMPYTPSVNAGVALSGYTSGYGYGATSGNTFLQPINNTNTAFITNAGLSTQSVQGFVTYQV